MIKLSNSGAYLINGTEVIEAGNEELVKSKLGNKYLTKEEASKNTIAYGILKDHVYLVYHNDEKLDVINKIKKLNPNLEDKYFVMIDDTVEVLNHIMDNSNFSTVHISSFLQ